MRMIFFLAIVGLLQNPLFAQTEGYLVGAAVEDITPGFPIRLTGYGSRQFESAGVEQKLHARALAVKENGSAEPAVICTVEVLGITPELRQAILAEVNKTQKLANERFEICATHTHTGPSINGVCPLILGDTIRPAEQKHIDQYSKELVPKVASAVTKAIANLKPGGLFFGRGKAGFAVNRRVLKDGIWSGFGVNPDGPVDHQLPILVVKDKSGKVAFVLANYACHCTTFGGRFNKISGDWAGYASEALEQEYPGSVALVSIGCGADANPEPRDGDEALKSAKQHGEELAKEVGRLIAGELRPLSGPIAGKITTIKLPFDRPRTKEEWEKLAKERNQTGTYGRYFLDLFNKKAVPKELDYTVSTLTFGDDLAMVFLAGEVVVDYGIRLSGELDANRLWVSSYSNDVPCYIPSRRILRERGYEADRSMEFYRRPNRFSPAIEDLIVDAVQRLLPPEFYSKEKRAEFPPPKSPAEAIGSFKLPAGLKLELAAAEPLIADPVAFDWGMDGSLWVVEMGDYPNGVDGQGKPGGRVKHLIDTDADGRFDQMTVFLKDLPFPTGVKVWRKGVLITAAPKILYAEDENGDGTADSVKTLYEGFGEGNQQHRVNGLRWGLDNWLYVGNGDSHGEIRSAKTNAHVSVRKRDLRIRPDEGLLEAMSGNTQFGINRDDWGNWFGGNNSNPMWQYVLNQRYLDRNPHVVPPEAKVMVSNQPGAAPVFPRSRTLHRFNDFYAANRFTSACSPMIYRDHLLGESYAGNAFVCEPVHNLVHREVVSQAGVRFASRRADSEQASEFFASDDNWSRPVMIRTGPDGALWVADFYRFVIEHPKWIPEHQQRKVDVRAGSDRGRIYRIVPERGARPMPNLEKLSIEELVKVVESPNGTLRDMAHQLLLWKHDPKSIPLLEKMAVDDPKPLARLHALCVLDGLDAVNEELLLQVLSDADLRVARHAVRISEAFVNESSQIGERWVAFAATKDPLLKMQVAYSLGEWKSPAAGNALAKILMSAKDDPYLTAAAVSSLTQNNLEAAIETCLKQLNAKSIPAYLTPVLQTALGQKRGDLAARLLLAILPDAQPITMKDLQTARQPLAAIGSKRGTLNSLLKTQIELRNRLQKYHAAALQTALDPNALVNDRVLAIGFLGEGVGGSSHAVQKLEKLISLTTPTAIQVRVVEAINAQSDDAAFGRLLKTFRQLTPPVKSAVLAGAERSSARQKLLLEAVERGDVPATELSVSLRQRLLDHRDSSIRRLAQKTLGVSESRKEILALRASCLKLIGDLERGQQVFKKQCSQCHKVGETGHAVGPDLASLTNRSPQAMFVAILDPNAAMEDKFAQYLAITSAGITHNGQLINETANSITFEGPESKRVELLRSDLEEFRSTGKSLMPEGLEKVLSDQDLADVMAYVGEIGPDPKSFPGLNPRKIVQDQGPIRLPASSAFLYGDLIRFERKYENLGTWGRPTDRAMWKLQVTEPGNYQIELDYSCDPLHAGNRFRLSLGNQTVDGTALSTGSWDQFASHPLGTVHLEPGPTRIVLQSIGPIRRESLMKLRTVQLSPK